MNTCSPFNTATTLLTSALANFLILYKDSASLVYNFHGGSMSAPYNISSADVSLTFRVDAEALEGRLLFAIPKKGIVFINPRRSVIYPESTGRLYEKCIELLSG